MLRLAASSSRPRLEALTRWIYSTQRHRTGGQVKQKPPAKPLAKLPASLLHSFFERTPQRRGHLPPRPHKNKGRSFGPRPTTKEEVIKHFERQVLPWSLGPSTLNRLELYGLPQDDCRKLLSLFAEAVQSGSLSTPQEYQSYQLDRFTFSRPEQDYQSMVFSTIFFWWVAKTPVEPLYQHGISADTLNKINTLLKAVDFSFPADQFRLARKKIRKIIMHVGPTNSGKTHHALRALAAAGVGVYAGPLRLLAHEIWERLNTGQIVPLGAELPKSEDGKPVISGSLKGDPRYRRVCNMITGEEQKLMEGHSNLLSCTIEMLPLNRYQDVAVIDEIQMIADEYRGNAWLNAVLGLDAVELHLCGEETAVPIIQNLIKHTGDELVVNRYERLTPLLVEESMDGDLTKIRKGDCIVAFSRSSIFALKKRVEQMIGLRCAVVYGRLPPEVRSEQAALFNDPNSGYDVLIGSDAIGMGLNLKIRRIIFDTVDKLQGGQPVKISVSSAKQIAGRAGRFGLGDSEDAVGGVTTLYKEDLPYLKTCIQKPLEPLPFATFDLHPTQYVAIERALPPDISMGTVLEVPAYVARFPPGIVFGSKTDKSPAIQYLQLFWPNMPVAEKLLVLNAPIPWRDMDSLNVIKKMLRMHDKFMSVDLHQALKGEHYLGVLEMVEEAMKANRLSSPREIQSALSLLESFHKTIVFYVWMGFRHPVVYSDFEEASVLKSRAERGLNWCLEKVGTREHKKAAPPPKLVRPAAELEYVSRAELKSRKLTTFEQKKLENAREAATA